MNGYDLTSSAELRRLLADARAGADMRDAREIVIGLTELLRAVESGGIELSVYADRNYRLRLRAKKSRPRTSADTSIAARFERFHKANPHIYEAIVARLRSLRDTGVERTSVKAIVENLRWSPIGVRRTDTVKPFKIQNDFTSRYARLVAERDPDLAVMLEVRTILSP